MKIALALIVKGDKTEADYLKNCLANVSGHVDKVFITITQPCKEVEDVANAFNAEISDYVWDNDFSKARNFNFSQVPKEFEYILWCDADDVFEGIEKLKSTIEENKADAYAMFYKYAFDEYNNPVVVHTKTQVVKNDGTFKWAGELHEDFKQTRDVDIYFIDGIKRVHTAKHEKFESAKERNLIIAKEQYKKYPDDPRCLWNLGNSLKAVGSNEEAIEKFTEFLKSSNSEDEKYIAYLRIAEAKWLLGQKYQAVEDVRQAIGTKPELPDAYNQIGILFFEMGRYKEASEYFLQGLVKKPKYHDIIVYNPRDYDYVPMMNLAKSYFHLGRPDLALPLLKGCKEIIPEDVKTDGLIKEMEKEIEKFNRAIKKIEKLEKIKDLDELKKELDKLPVELQSHPSICVIRNTKFIKNESSGKDIVFLCGFTEFEWTPKIAKEKGIGGSEEAVIWLAKLFSKKGYNVTVYNNCGHKEQEFDGVKYKPFWTWNYRDKQDIVILWRTPKMADYPINAGKVFVDLHDVIMPGEFTKERLKRINRVFVKSKFHRTLFENIPDEKIVVVSNGIDTEQFYQEVTKDENLIINTSSPDRSLTAFIGLVEEIKKYNPDIKAKWAYGWRVFDIHYGGNEKMMKWKEEIQKKMKEVGIEEMGMISHEDVKKLYLKSKVFLYPSEFAEIDCISLTKALAAGAVPVTTNFAAMGEKQIYGFFTNSEKTKDDWCVPGQIDFSIKDQKQKKEMLENIKKALNANVNLINRKYTSKFDWEEVCKVWINNF